MSLKLNVIVAACENMGIGHKNDLPWTLRKEMAYFTRMTSTTEHPGSGKTNAVLMGRRTWDSIPVKYRPLKNRINVVLSSNFQGPSDIWSYNNWDAAITDLNSPEKKNQIEKVWVIGGNQIYKMALDSPLCHRVYLTRVLKNFECDVFFPEIDTAKFQLVKDSDVPEEEQEENGIKYRFEVYENIN